MGLDEIGDVGEGEGVGFEELEVEGRWVSFLEGREERGRGFFLVGFDGMREGWGLSRTYGS